VVAPLGAPPSKAPEPVAAQPAAPVSPPRPAFLAEQERSAPPETAGEAPEPLARVTGRRGLFNVFRK
jgi:hypothetical protein